MTGKYIDVIESDKAYIDQEKCPVFGVRYAVANMPGAVGFVKEHLEDLRGKYVCFSNVHTTVMAKENDDYLKVLNEAELVFADGRPVAKRQNSKGFKRAERVAGPDFMREMFKATSDRSVSHFFYGAKQDTLDKLKDSLLLKYPGINIKGMYSPPFRALSEEEDQADVDMINASGADIIWVGLGAPKQEKWMNAHKDRVNGVMMGVGAGFDFHAGTIKRAPVWMQKAGLEWFFRLTQDPKRLFGRYLVTNTKFLWYSIKDR